MFKTLLFLHLLAAIFAIGPLVHAATTASRGIRTGDARATASSARTAKVYSYASLLVVVLGVGLMSTESPHTHQTTASFGETWIWLSTLLWLVAVGLTLGVVVPALDRATSMIGGGQSPAPLTAKVAASGGTVGLIIAVIVLLMVWQPGG